MALCVVGPMELELSSKKMKIGDALNGEGKSRKTARKGKEGSVNKALAKFLQKVAELFMEGKD